MGWIVGLVVLLGLWVAPAAAQLPAEEQWREGLLNFRVGYGRFATGGAGGTLCTVNTLADAGGAGQTGSLRHCLGLSGPQWIIFSVSGTIQLDSFLGATGSNHKTVDGRGATITIVGPTSGGQPALYISGEYNQIWHNVAFRSGGGFIIRILCGVRIWFDHIDLAGAGPNLTALGMGTNGGTCPNGVTGETMTTEMTLSYFKAHDRCYFGSYATNPELCGSGFFLIGQEDNEATMANARFTLHHNWYQHSASTRFPNVRLARAHSFNNYMDNTDQGGDIITHGQLVSEHDIFDCSVAYGDGLDCGATGTAVRFHCNYTNAGTPTPSDNCRVTNPWLVAGTETYDQQNPGTAFNPALDYSYTLETADAALRSKITNATTGAGVVPNPYNTMSGAVPIVLRLVR